MGAHRVAIRHTERALDGKIVLPEHGIFDEARRAWNLFVDQQPAAVVYAETDEDVAAAIRFACEHDQRIAAQGTGHGASPMGPLADTILLKTERLGGVEIDPDSQTARVGAGAIWIDVVEAAAKHGLAATAGSAPNVGVVGYSLGGGLSFIGRKHGLSANNVLAADAVTADGRIVRADFETRPDLFWALRGGGGGFAVVTALELQLHPLTEAYAGALWWPATRGSEVLQIWRELTLEAPDELATLGRFLNLPPIPEVPEPMRGKSFVVIEAVHIGERAEADELLAPLRALAPDIDAIAMVPMPALSALHMDPEPPSPAVGDGVMLAELSGEAIDQFVRIAGPESSSPLLSVEIRHLGGELGRPRPRHGALSSLESDYALYAVGLGLTPEMGAASATYVEMIKSSMAPWSTRHMFLNFAETSRAPDTFWSERAYQRLRRIKGQFDPDDVIRSNHPIPPLSLQRAG